MDPTDLLVIAELISNYLTVSITIFAVYFLVGLPSAYGIQSSGNTYDVGPDPIADSLPQSDQTNDGTKKNDDILNMDIDQLGKAEVLVPAMNITVESVSRTTRTLAQTPSAVYVVTNEMIRRCGARNIPEVLRTVPGVNVARINNCAWAISVRGINGRQAGMLLVQIDGVAIYNPIHSGVFWERNHVLLKDVERIEVNEKWQLTSWYAFLVEDVHFPTGYDPAFTLGGTPRNEFYFQSGWDLGRDVSLDVMFRYVDSLAAGVEEYLVADVRLAWRPTKRFEMSLVGQNLLNGDYYEFVNSAVVKPTKTQPGVYGMASWRYYW